MVLISARHRFSKKIADLPMIQETINLYHQGLFPEMKGFIMEYGEHEFFQDLFQYLDSEEWRRPLNKYMIFVGITIQYFKIYT